MDFSSIILAGIGGGLGAGFGVLVGRVILGTL